MTSNHAILGEPPSEAIRLLAKLENNVASVFLGQPEVTRLALVALLAEGHLLIEDVPGIGKTLLAKALARSLGCSFHRIQFTPDLLPSDVTGVSIYNQETRDFEVKPGAIFANVVLGINPNWTPGAMGMAVAWQAHLAGYFAGLLLVGLFARLAGRDPDDVGQPPDFAP